MKHTSSVTFKFLSRPARLVCRREKLFHDKVFGSVLFLLLVIDASFDNLAMISANTFCFFIMLFM